MTPRTESGLVKYRPLRAGSRVALVAPASPFDRAEFDAGVVELRRLGLEPVFDDVGLRSPRLSRRHAAGARARR